MAAQALLSPDAAARFTALNNAVVGDRPTVLLSALTLDWQDVRVEGADAGERILRWLMTHGGTTTFARYIAEDTRWGFVAQPALCTAARQDALIRMPEWLSRPAADAEAVMRAWGASSAADIAALCFRMGSCSVPDAAWKAAIPSGGGWVGGLAAGWGGSHPTASWRPNAVQLGRTPRRWPIPRIEESMAVVCTMCAEVLPAVGECGWCGTDPDAEPPSLAPFAELFVERVVCEDCAVDRAVRMAPVRCPGCAKELV